MRIPRANGRVSTFVDVTDTTTYRYACTREDRKNQQLAPQLDKLTLILTQITALTPTPTMSSICRTMSVNRVWIASGGDLENELGLVGSECDVGVSALHARRWDRVRKRFY